MTATALRPSGGVLWTRSLCFGVVAASLAALGHWSISGVHPSPTLWAGVVALAALGSRWFLDRERGFVSILFGLVAVQVVLHLSLTVPAGHEHAAQKGASLAMLLVHTGATAAAAFWLRRGEAAVWRRLRRAADGALGFLSERGARWRALHHLVASTSIPGAQSHHPRRRPLVDKLSSRGPPSTDRPCME